MNKDDLRKLAKLTVQTKSVDPKVSYFVKHALTRKKLIIYLNYLKNELNKKIVKVLFTQKLSNEVTRAIQAKFAGRPLVYEETSDLGDGIKIIDNDTIINLTARGILDEITRELASK